MIRNRFIKTTNRSSDPTSPSIATAAFRGRSLRGLEAFGWHTAGHAAHPMRYRVIDHRTLQRPRRP